jgi:periplasmic divalent cation tolerance protein
MTDARLILSTADSEAMARTLATGLVGEHLAACVTIVPGVHSVYRWQGQVESATEWLLLIKTTAAQVEPLLATLAERHPYDVPEGLVLPVNAGLPDYLAWLADAVGGAGGKSRE